MDMVSHPRRMSMRSSSSSSEIDFMDPKLNSERRSRNTACTEDQLRRYLQWQLTVLRFIDQRFRPGVLVTEEEVRAYYDEHRAELQKANPREQQHRSART